jgi:hypothetical protein
MLKVTSIEELTALNIVLEFTTVAELLTAAMHGFVVSEEPTTKQQEQSDLCWKVLKTLR